MSRFTALGSIRINDITAPPVPTHLQLTGIDSGMLARWDGPVTADRDTFDQLQPQAFVRLLTTGSDYSGPFVKVLPQVP